jgi:hypothetical protein
MTGGDVGLGALAGGIGGAIGGAVGFKTLKWDLPGRVAAQVISGSVSGGIASVINGGNFWEGMAWGAAGAAIASGIGAVIEIATQTESSRAAGRSGEKVWFSFSVDESSQPYFHAELKLQVDGGDPYAAATAEALLEYGAIIGQARSFQAANRGFFGTVRRYGEWYGCSSQCAELSDTINARGYRYWRATVAGGMNRWGNLQHVVLVSPTQLKGSVLANAISSSVCISWFLGVDHSMS